MEDMGKMLEMEEQNLDYKKGDVINGEVIELFDNKSLLFPSAIRQKLFCRFMNTLTRNRHP